MPAAGQTHGAANEANGAVEVFPTAPAFYGIIAEKSITYDAMTRFIASIKAHIGEFWWYSLMIFIACRSGDAIQAFIGLWLVPKYIGTEELGAVLPLQQLSGFFAVPLTALATVFSKYVNTYATRGDYAKVKSFIKDTLSVACVVFIFCIIAAYVVIPHFYLRLNVVSGMLTILILATGFIGNVSNLLASALQGLKKFKIVTLQNLVSAPIRLMTLLIAMPFRPLSGYILGQATPPATCSLLAAWSLRKDLKPFPADTSWRQDLPDIWRFLWPTALYTLVLSALASVNLTVYRQRLPELESAAYYLLSRFSEISGYAGMSMMMVLFPLSSEAHERGKENPRPLFHSFAATAAITLALALAAALFAPQLLSLNETWRQYLPFATLLVPLTLTTGIGVIVSSAISYEMACRRFSLATIIAIANVAFSALLVSFAGCEFFRGFLPDGIVDWMNSLHIASLDKITFLTLLFSTLQLLAALACLKFPRHPPKHSPQ